MCQLPYLHKCTDTVFEASEGNDKDWFCSGWGSCCILDGKFSSALRLPNTQINLQKKWRREEYGRQCPREHIQDMAIFTIKNYKSSGIEAEMLLPSYCPDGGVGGEWLLSHQNQVTLYMDLWNHSHVCVCPVTKGKWRTSMVHIKGPVKIHLTFI